MFVKFPHEFLLFDYLSTPSIVRHPHLLELALVVCRSHLEKRFSIDEKIAADPFCCFKRDQTVCSDPLSLKNKQIKGFMD